MKLNKKIFVILVSLLFTFLCGCTQNTQSEPTEQPHLYWKDIDVVVENVDSRHWFASTHHYIVYVTVRSDEYQLTYSGTNDFVPMNQAVEYSGIEMAVNRQGMLRVRVLDNDGGFTTQDIIEIRNCPLCGKRFMKGRCV